MKNLKNTAKELQNDIHNNNDWINREISFVIDGSYDNYNFYQMLLDTYTKDKPNRGKRGANLIARVGSEVIQKVYNCNSNQSLSVYKYLTTEAKEIFTKDIIDSLDSFFKMMES